MNRVVTAELYCKTPDGEIVCVAERRITGDLRQKFGFHNSGVIPPGEAWMTDHILVHGMAPEFDDPLKVWTDPWRMEAEDFAVVRLKVDAT